MFSLSVKLAELNDFLAPSQDCVKSTSEGTSKPSLIKPTTAVTETDEEVKTGHVNLTDCLACSGCVTSAASVLLEAQSHTELLKRVKKPDLEESDSVDSQAVIIISLSSQSEAALSAAFNLSIPSLYRVLQRFLRGFGVAHVLDMNVAQAMYAAEAGAWLSNKTSSTSVIYGSHCPGWICYAEKVHPEDISNQLLPVPPVQIWQGLIVKTLFSDPTLAASSIRNQQASRMVGSKKYYSNMLKAHHGRHLDGMKSSAVGSVPDRIYHVSVQPCHDKKLESIRPEFRKPIGPYESPVTLVDLVLVTSQFIVFLEELGLKRNPEISYQSQEVCESEPSQSGLDLIYLNAFGLLSNPERMRRLTMEQSENGGLAGAIFDWSADAKPNFVVGLNSDHVVSAKPGTGGWRIEMSSGFRNIRNMLSGVSRRRGKHLIEQLACPKGCLNGPGHSGLSTVDGAPVSVNDMKIKGTEDTGRLEVDKRVVEALRWYVEQIMVKQVYLDGEESVLGKSARTYIFGGEFVREDSWSSSSSVVEGLDKQFKFEFVHVRDEDHLESSQW